MNKFQYSTNKTDAELFIRAQAVIPGGVNSPVRAFQSVGGTPVFVKQGHGSKIVTSEDRELVDFCGSWGPLILGHAHPQVVEDVKTAVGHGMTFGINTEREVEFAELLCRQIPYMDQVRLVSSGTEATMTALRLARGVTGRNKIMKFDGCYHGHADYLLVAAGSGLLTGGTASSAGVCTSAVQDVLLAPYNDIVSVNNIIAEHGDDIAAIIVEPIAGNMGLIMPDEGFLEGLREAASRCGAILIFDEVISGFRLSPTTYGNSCGITPDLTCLGKIIGGGMPMGAVGGRRDIMENLAPLGDVYQAGTLSGNPVAIAAGMSTLKILINDYPYDRIEKLAEKLVTGVREKAHTAGVDINIAIKGGMFTIFFQKENVYNLDDAKKSNTSKHAAFFHSILNSGFYLQPSQFEVCFVSAAHNEDDIATFVVAAGKAFKT